MTWRPVSCLEAICDRCGAECDPDDEGVIHFPAGPGAVTELERWHWHVVTVLGVEHLICQDCWENAGADDDTLARAELTDAIAAAIEAPERWDQDGPNLLDATPGGDRS